MPVINSQRISMLYGTAWKKSQTSALVTQAIAAGFRGIDTAAQPKHYQEDLVGQSIRSTISSNIVNREDLYIQTKYTSFAGQDPNSLPYNPSDSITSQVQSSIASSLSNLRHGHSVKEAYIDCLVLHSPLPTFSETLEAWSAMSAYVPSRIRKLGISNVTLPVLRSLCEDVDVKPQVVQNRFYAQTAYDVPIRKFCRDNGIEYQGFWTLTANPALVRSQLVAELAAVSGVEAAVALYALVQAMEIVVLNGTQGHMETDLAGLRKLEVWTGREGNPEAWRRFVEGFRRLIGEL